MAVGAVGDIFEAITQCSCGGQIGLNVRHWRTTFIIGDSASEQEIADELSTIIAPYYKQYLNMTQARYDGLRLQKIAPLPKRDAVISAEGAGSGTQEDVDQMPTQVAGLLTLRTGLAGRAKRGRAYLPFFNEHQNTTVARPEATVAAYLDDFGLHWSTAITVVGAAGSATIEPVIFHRSNLTADRITAWVSRNHWGTQRRRSFVREAADSLVVA